MPTTQTAPKKAKATTPGVQIGHPAAPKAAKAKKAVPEAPKVPAVVKAAGGAKAQALADAQAGILPDAPDFSANTHSRFRGRLEKVVAMVNAGDVKALEAEVINPVSSSPKALKKYRDLAVIALKAQQLDSKAKAPKAEKHADDASLSDAEKKLAGIPVEAEPI